LLRRSTVLLFPLPTCEERMSELTEWSDARTAAIFLKPCTPKHINEELGVYLRRESANRPGTRTARSGGWRYHREDLERVRAIMDALGCSPLRAAQHFHAIKTLAARDLLELMFAGQLEETLAKERVKRRFQ
jgi:hypothetical protein